MVCLLACADLCTYLVCPTEILAFNAALPKFAELNTEVLAVSTDSQFSHLAWANLPRAEGGLGPDLKLKLVADKSMKMARDYGVLLEDDGVALRGLFLIDPKGTLRQITVRQRLAELCKLCAE